MDNQDNIISPVSPAAPAPEHHFSKTLMLVIVLVLVGAISAGAYFGIFTPKNKVTLGQAVVNTLTDAVGDKINSGTISVSLKVTAKDVNENYSDLATDPTSRQVISQVKDISANLKYTGIFNKNSNGEPETSGELSLSIKNPNGGTIGMFPAQDMNLEYRVFTDTVYVNIKTLPSLAAMVLPPTVNTSKYLNQWFSSPNMSPKITATTTFTVEMKENIIDLFDDSGAFKIVDQKAEKTEGGTSVTALYVKIDLDKLGDAIIRLGKDANKGVALSKAEEMDIRANIEKIKELPVSDGTLKFLVGDDGYLYGYMSSGDLMTDKGVNVGNFEVMVSADKFNETFKIERPANARDFSAVMAEMSGMMMR